MKQLDSLILFHALLACFISLATIAAGIMFFCAIEKFALWDVIYSILILAAGMVFALCVASVGANIRTRSNYGFCVFMSFLECVILPFGTLLGLMTLALLLRPSIRRGFARDDNAMLGNNR